MRQNYLALLGYFLVALLPIFCMTFSDSFAQSRSAVRIIAISGDDGTPIGGANAVLFRGESDEFDDMQGAGATNSDGLYEFDRIDPGLYTLKVSFVGH